MRSPPPPVLHDVLVSRPGNAPSTAVIRRDDLFATAVLAAEESAAQQPQRSRRSVLARVSRRWAKLSDSLRRRGRASTAASQSAAAAAAALAAPEQQRRAPINNRNELVAAFDRERVRRAEALIEREGRFEEEMAVCSLRETSTRRVRQFGARDDDDTLLMLPRVASVSFSTPDSNGETSPIREPAARVRQLPRVSGLMPMRAPRPLATVSPVSSQSGNSASRSMGSDFSESSASDRFDDADHDDTFSDRAEEDIDAEAAMNRRALHRLPTGMSNKDVEREMEHAVVEIASEGESDLEGSGEVRLAGEGVMIDRARSVGLVTRSKSEVHRDFPRRFDNDPKVVSAFARRASSTTQNRRLLPEEEGEARAMFLVDQKGKYQSSKDYALFEDDYLSFQGFHGQSESPSSHFQSMSSLLRSKRISSVTDSHSEGSDEGAALKAVGHTESRRKQNKKNGIIPPVQMWFKRGGSVSSGDS